LIEAELEIIEGLPPTLAQGLFATAGRYPAVMRLSTIPGDVLDDNVTVPRAVALKVIGVSGERLPMSEESVTQDLLMANGPAFAAPNAKKFLVNLKLLAKRLTRLRLSRRYCRRCCAAQRAPWKQSAVKVLLKNLGGHPNTHILGSIVTGTQLDRTPEPTGGLAAVTLTDQVKTEAALRARR
jgi:hypothetical protein